MTGEPVGRGRPRRERAGMAGIRAFWFAMFGGLGYAVDYLIDIDRLRDIGLAVPVAIGLGAALYGAKRYWWPDTKW